MEEVVKTFPDHSLHDLKRFYIAAEGNVSKTIAGVNKYLTWKEEYVATIKEEDLIHIRSSKIVYAHGRSVHNYLICYSELNNDVNIDDFIKYIVYLIEKIKNNRARFIWIIDLKKYQIKRKSGKRLIKKCIMMLDGNYPGLVSKLYIVNMPWYTKIFRPVIMALVNKKTKQALNFTSRGDIAKKVKDIIDPDMLSTQYGGNLKITYKIKEKFESNLY
jgi:hypothetical protein